LLTSLEALPERKCSGGVWCQCKDCKKIAFQEEQRLTRTAMKTASRMGGKGRISVVLTQRSEDFEDPAYLSII
jgi:hypothetical protein